MLPPPRARRRSAPVTRVLLAGACVLGAAACAEPRPDVPPQRVGSTVRADGELQHATFAMACFWQGEARLGALDGVLASRAGWQDGREVVEVTFDPARLAREELVTAARGLSCSAVAEAGSARAAKASDQKYFLRRAPHRYLPLTELQRVKVNSALGLRRDPSAWLAAEQLELLHAIQARLEANPSALSELEPDDVQDLAAYEQRLRAALNS